MVCFIFSGCSILSSSKYTILIFRFWSNLNGEDHRSNQKTWCIWTVWNFRKYLLNYTTWTSNSSQVCVRLPQSRSCVPSPTNISLNFPTSFVPNQRLLKRSASIKSVSNEPWYLHHEHFIPLITWTLILMLFKQSFTSLTNKTSNLHFIEAQKTRPLK